MFLHHKDFLFPSGKHAERERERENEKERIRERPLFIYDSLVQIQLLVSNMPGLEMASFYSSFIFVATKFSQQAKIEHFLSSVQMLTPVLLYHSNITVSILKHHCRLISEFLCTVRKVERILQFLYHIDLLFLIEEYLVILI